MFAYRELIADPLFECDAVLYLRIAPARAVRLKYIDASPVRTLGGEWKARFLYTGLQGVLLLGLEQNALQATWILSPDGRRLGDRLADLDADLRAGLAASLLARGADLPRGLIGDGLQMVEPALLHGLLDLAGVARARQTAFAAPVTVHPGLAMLGAPHRLQPQLRFGPGERGLLLHEGWDENTGAAIAQGPISVARAGLVAPCGRGLLTLCLVPIEVGEAARPTALELRVNGRVIAGFELHPHWHREGATLSCWLGPDIISGKPFEVALHHEQAFRLERLQLDLDPVRDAAALETEGLGRAELEPADLMLQFENIGDNCEFGLVQRHFKAEPVGLLRFGGLRNPGRLIHMLDDDFGELGAAGSLGVMMIGVEYWITDQVYGLTAHTFRYKNECSAEEVIRENEIKLTYLRRKFREDLEDGEKILVYKRVVTQDLHEVLALHAALNRFGTINKLLWVTEAGDHHVPGDVEWVGDHILKGYVGRISLTDANDFDAAIWLRLCRNARAAFGTVRRR